MCGIARHKLADHFRALERDERRQVRMELRQIEMPVDGQRRGGDRRTHRVIEALRTLPASQRAVLVFVVLDDLPVAEAARLLGKSPEATESLLFRAREGSSSRVHRARSDR